MPVIEFSSVEFISDICLREFFIAWLIFLLDKTVKRIMNGTMVNIISVRVRLMLASMENEPINISTARKRFSGP